jgi:hypothetical protein
MHGQQGRRAPRPSRTPASRVGELHGRAARRRPRHLQQRLFPCAPSVSPPGASAPCCRSSAPAARAPSGTSSTPASLPTSGPRVGDLLHRPGPSPCRSAFGRARPHALGPVSLQLRASPPWPLSSHAHTPAFIRPSQRLTCARPAAPHFWPCPAASLRPLCC